MILDISETTEPKSDQQQYDDYLGGKTRTVTVSAVTKGSPEQPVNVELVEYPGRPFRPNKTMRRLLVLAWGADSSAYTGRRLTLVGNPGVVFGGKPVGGVEISALSHIDKPLTVALTATRGKRKNFTVKPLTEAPSSPNATLSDEDTNTWVDLLTKSTTLEELQRNWGLAARERVTDDARILAAKDKRKGELATPDSGNGS